MAHLLIVDDSPTIRRMVKVALTPLSMDVIEAGSGLEAIEQLAVAPVSLMVLDLNMPDMHGLEVLGFVRANQKFHNIPIIVLTTRGDDASRDAARHAGATRYLTKPFTPQALLSEAREVLTAAVQDAR
jgi:two-component system, chemotaxis family, chemotaxis protein CheY